MKESQPGKANPAARGPAQTFPSGKRFVVVAESAIRWIEARGRRSRIHAVDEVVEADQGISSALAGSCGFIGRLRSIWTGSPRCNPRRTGIGS
jgi:hypothetical protein